MIMQRGQRYIDALSRIRGVLDAVEGALVLLPNETPLTPSRIAQMLGYSATMDHCTLALAALADLGVVPAAYGGAFDHATFVDSAQFRAGVRAGMDAVSSQVSNTGLRLIQAVPGGLQAGHRAALQREADDLRAAIVDLIISARENLVLASPFWDDDTADELGQLLIARVRSGVRVDVLGRPPSRVNDAFAHLAQRLCVEQTAHAYVWSYAMEGLPFGTQTFHFKAIVADGGAKAYLGSANFTTASLRSRMELGVLFYGGDAHKLARIMDEVLTIACPYHGC